MKDLKLSASIFLCLIIFLLATINGFSQVAQKKQTAGPVTQKQITTPHNTEQKKAVNVNSVEKQFVKQDTANAKLTDVTISMEYRTAANSSPDMVRTHYKPRIDLLDKDSHNVADWTIDNPDYTSSQTPNQKGNQWISIHMKINKSDASYASLQKGTIKIGGITFSSGMVPDWFSGKMVQDYFTVESLYVTLKFLNPGFTMPIGAIFSMERSIEPASYQVELNLNRSSAGFSFFSDSPKYGLLSLQALY